MDNQFLFCLIFLGIPFACLTLMYVVLVVANWKTTGEIKMILPPEILLKVFAVFMVAGVIFALAVLKIIQESTVSALLGAVATGVLGFSAKKEGWMRCPTQGVQYGRGLRPRLR